MPEPLQKIADFGAVQEFFIFSALMHSKSNSISIWQCLIGTCIKPPKKCTMFHIALKTAIQLNYADYTFIIAAPRKYGKITGALWLCIHISCTMWIKDVPEHPSRLQVLRSTFFAKKGHHSINQSLKVPDLDLPSATTIMLPWGYLHENNLLQSFQRRGGSAISKCHVALCRRNAKKCHVTPGRCWRNQMNNSKEFGERNI